MKRFAAMVVGLVVLFGFVRAGVAQDRTPEELDQMLGPIALYPDPLVAEILSAATFPSQIVVADRYMQGGGDVNQVAQQPWDPSVQAMCHYANVLKWLDDNLQWTTQLGQAYTSQPTDVMDSVQRLRAQAQGLGNLPSTPQETVTDDNGDIEIDPADPDNIYVPDYSASTIYFQPGIFCTFGFGFPIGGWLVNDWDWHSHRMIAWGPGHPRPDNWWRQTPIERRGYLAQTHVPTWHGGDRGTIVAHAGWDRGYEPAVISRSVPAPAVPRSAGERIAQARAETQPAFRAPSAELPHNFARPEPEPARGGEAFGGLQSAPAVRESSMRGAESRASMGGGGGGFHGGGGGGGNGKR